MMIPNPKHPANKMGLGSFHLAFLPEFESCTRSGPREGRSDATQ